MQLHEFQLTAARDVWRAFREHKSVLLQAPCGGGKCFARGTPILLSDGKIVPVEDIQVGDRLAGPNGSCTVTSLARGREEMFRVTPVKGMPYVVNRSHILSLKMTANADGYKRGDIVNLTVNDYLEKLNWFKDVAKGWRGSVDVFESGHAALTIPPYILGLWIGDGTSRVTAITTMDHEVVEAWTNYAVSIGAFINYNDCHGTQCPTYRLSYGRTGDHHNAMLDRLRDYRLILNKHVPHAYKVATREHRLEMLAGIIDTDGYLANGCYNLVFKQHSLAEDICFIARSLGLAAYMKPCIKGIKALNFKRTYYRISISGEIDMIPCRVQRRKAVPRKQIKNVLVTGLTVKSLGDGEYFGFTLEGPDRLFFLGDFTVAHNTVMGSFLVKAHLQHRGFKTLVTAHRREIVDQTAEKLRAAGLECGVIMAGRTPQPYEPVQVASIDSLMARVKNGMMMPEAQLLWIDETHRGASARYLKLIDYYKAQGALIFGTTATPMRSDGVGLKQIFEFMVRTPDVPWLIENHYLCPVRYAVGILPDVSGVTLTAGDYNQAELQQVVDQELLIGDIVDNWIRLAGGRRTMVFAAGVQHSMHLMRAFESVGIRAAHIDAKTPKDIRERVKADLESGVITIICNAMVYVEGTDIPCIECIVFAQPTKSPMKYLQEGGRGLRTSPGKQDLLVLDHAGVVFHHGRLEMARDWKLTEGREQLEAIQKARKKEIVEFTCKACGALFRGMRCPVCGEWVEFTGKAKDYLPADLVQLTNEQFDLLMKPPKPTPFDKRDWYAQLIWIADEKGRQRGWADHIFKEKFGHWPAMKQLSPMKAKPEVLSYVRSRWIKRKYQMAKAAAHG